MVTLVEGITNAWVRYQLLDEDPKAALLHVVSTRNADSWDKVRMMTSVLKKHPELKDQVLESELYDAFCRLVKLLESRDEVPSLKEFRWVSKFIETPLYFRAIEEAIFSGMLTQSDFTDKPRQEHKWLWLSEEVKQELAAKVLRNKTMTAKRKTEIAKEFALPWREYGRQYFKTLLQGAKIHLAAATQIGLGRKDVEEVALAIIRENLNTDYSDAVQNAEEIAKYFLPDRLEIIIELGGIREKFESLPRD